MEEIELRYVPLYSLGYLHTRVPTDILLDLEKQTSDILSNNFRDAEPHNKNLYGAIEREVVLPNQDKLTRYVLELSKHYWFFQHQPQNANKVHKVEAMWVNFQKKYEHNPVHNHTGVLSFVVWLKIPYNLNDEIKIDSVRNSNRFHIETAGFTFLYSTPDTPAGFEGLTKHPIPMTKEREGEIILFKSSTPHMVYPFYTSDDYRISISGNLYFED